MSRNSRSRPLALLVSVALVAACGVFLWKGVTLAALHAEIIARSSSVASFYRESIGRHVQPLLSGEIGAAGRSALDSLTASALRLDGGNLQDIVKTQQGVVQLQNTVQHPAVTELLDELRKGGTVQPVLDAYNIRVQAWNNAIDDPLGRLYAKIFGLGHRLLLQPDGRMETETEVTL
jgi:hypothetical protein